MFYVSKQMNGEPYSNNEWFEPFKSCSIHSTVVNGEYPSKHFQILNIFWTIHVLTPFKHFKLGLVWKSWMVSTMHFLNPFKHFEWELPFDNFSFLVLFVNHSFFEWSIPIQLLHPAHGVNEICRGGKPAAGARARIASSFARVASCCP